jgi:ABC-type amino acid transport substrate-binding protein
MSPRQLLALAVLVPAAAARPVAAADLPDIMRSGALRVLVAADESPEFFALEPGPSPGFEREILEGFARLHKVRLETVPIVRFDDAIPALLRGQGDLITGMIDTEARRRQVAFTVEVRPPACCS